jgi:sigma-B regulation protein RsbU (phosphoserine phosphatase)
MISGLGRFSGFIPAVYLLPLVIVNSLFGREPLPLSSYQISIDLEQLVGNVLASLKQASQSSNEIVAQLQQLQNLVSNSARITSSLHLDQVLDQVMDSVLDLTGAERAYLMLRDPENDVLTIRKARNWENQSNLEQDQAFSRSVIRSALEKAEPIVAIHIQEDSRFSNAQSVITQGLQAVLCIPLILDGKLIGVLYADHRSEPAIFSEGMIPLLAAFGTQAAIAIEKARLHEKEIKLQRIDKELSVGQQIQLSLLPKMHPSVPGWDFAATYQAARVVGGDFYDFVELPDGKLGIVVADVADKGIPAAIFMAVSRTIIHTTALSDFDPAEVLVQANQLILQDNTNDLFLTAFYSVLDTTTGQLVFANGGHNHPLLLRAETASFEALAAPGIVLGVLPDIQLDSREVWLSAGDILVFYTDGLTEAMDLDFQEFGEARLCQSIFDSRQGSANEIIKAIVEAMRQFVNGAEQSDDLTIVVIKYKL